MYIVSVTALIRILGDNDIEGGKDVFKQERDLR